MLKEPPLQFAVFRNDENKLEDNLVYSIWSGEIKYRLESTISSPTIRYGINVIIPRNGLYSSTKKLSISEIPSYEEHAKSVHNITDRAAITLTVKKSYNAVDMEWIYQLIKDIQKFEKWCNSLSISFVDDQYYSNQHFRLTWNEIINIAHKEDLIKYATK